MLACGDTGPRRIFAPKTLLARLIKHTAEVPEQPKANAKGEFRIPKPRKAVRAYVVSSRG